jgi:8-oxo-dGTP pyrophosphatase MutT (NUDIX family)
MARGRILRLAALLPDYARTALRGLFSHRIRRGERIVVQAVILSEQGVLLTVRHDLRGWELPGGNLDPGESELDGLLREVHEETGLRVEVLGLVGEYRRTGFLPHRARVYRCRPVSGVLTPSAETPLVRWWEPLQVPTTLFPWYRTPLQDALAESSEPAQRDEHLGLAEIWAGMRTDLRMRWSSDRAV